MAIEKPKILIVDDEAPLRNALYDKFVREGFEVCVAKNGIEGLKMVSEKSPSLILLDIIMPVMDGLSMLQKLRKMKHGKKIPVIILTNLSDTAKIAEAIKHGTYDYLVKSNWKLTEVVDKVRETLGKK